MFCSRWGRGKLKNSTHLHSRSKGLCESGRLIAVRFGCPDWRTSLDDCIINPTGSHDDDAQHYHFLFNFSSFCTTRFHSGLRIVTHLLGRSCFIHKSGSTWRKKQERYMLRQPGRKPPFYELGCASFLKNLFSIGRQRRVGGTLGRRMMN